MKIIRWSSVTLLPPLSLLLLISVLVRGAQAGRSATSITREKVEDSTLTWARVAPANEDFVVWMPGVPKVGAEELMIDQQPVILGYYSLTEGGTDYAILTVCGVKSRSAFLAHILMLNLYYKLITASLPDQSEKDGVAVEATFQRDIQLNAYIGREYGIKAHHRTGLWRLYSAGRKFYAVAALTNRADDRQIKRFLNSFTLTSSTSVVTAREPVQPPPGMSPKRASPVPSSAKGGWLVILRTFSKAERSEANHKLGLLWSLGYDAHIVETDYFANLKRGLVAVVMGPYSKRAAEGLLNKVRSVAPGAYIKSGW